MGTRRRRRKGAGPSAFERHGLLEQQNHLRTVAQHLRNAKQRPALAGEHYQQLLDSKLGIVEQRQAHIAQQLSAIGNKRDYRSMHTGIDDTSSKRRG